PRSRSRSVAAKRSSCLSHPPSQACIARPARRDEAEDLLVMLVEDVLDAAEQFQTIAEAVVGVPVEQEIVVKLDPHRRPGRREDEGIVGRLAVVAGDDCGPPALAGSAIIDGEA